MGVGSWELGVGKVNGTALPRSQLPDPISASGASPKVALVHDYLNQYGGAERVLEELHAIFPSAPVYTSMYWPEKMSPIIRGLDVRTSFMQRLPLVTRNHKHLCFSMRLRFKPSACPRTEVSFSICPP